MGGLGYHDTDVCVIGAGPAGTTLATRLAQLGHEVCLLERAAFPRRRLGEALTPGVLSLLEASGARAVVGAAGFPETRAVDVDWDRGAQRRENPAGERGLLVDRGRFDALLLEHARAAGVRVLQPAGMRSCEPVPEGWKVSIASRGRAFELRAAFLADGRGRSVDTRRTSTGHGTLALHAYWRGDAMPERPRIEAGEDGWLWGVPLPDGIYNTLVFLDRAEVQARRKLQSRSLAALFHEALTRSTLSQDCRGLTLASPVRAVDATPYLHLDPVTTTSIRVGDAALAVDPISSSGVQKAIRTALSGAVVVNTLLRRPTSGDVALRFYRESLRRASDQHRAWAASHYAAAATRRPHAFWHDRADHAPAGVDAEPERRLAADLRTSATLRLSSELEFVELPCLEAEYVSTRRGVRHPALEEPLVFLAGWELAPLLGRLPEGATPLQLVQVWASQVPLRSGVALVQWLLRRGLLELEAATSKSAAASPGGAT